MHLPVLSSDPDAGGDVGRVAYEPAVGVVVGGSRLAGNLPLKPVDGAQARARTLVDHGLHEVDHEVGGLLGDGLALAGRIASDLHAFAVGDSRDILRVHVGAVRREGVVGRNHVEHVDFGRPHAERIDLVDVGGYAHLAHHGGEGGRPELLHQVGGDVVRTPGETPAEGDRLPYVLGPVGASRRPGGSVVEHEGLGEVHHLVAGGHALLHGQGVEERLDRGADLALALAHVVVFEISVVGSADIGLHVSGARLYRHESASEYGLVVAYGVVGGHGGVDVSLVVPCEHPHPRRLAELGVDLGVALAGAVLQTVAVAPATRLLHQHLGRLVVDAVGEGLVALPAHLLVEEVLQVASEVFVDRLLGVLLHLVVDGGVDAQSVAVKVVARAVGLPVLVEPSVYGVLPPAE